MKAGAGRMPPPMVAIHMERRPERFTAELQEFL
jgi:hypothetical protein